MKPLSMKHAVATIERGERRDIPQTPCPLVHPEPYRVPIPTNTPATMSSNPPPWNSISGNVTNRPHSSGAASRPKKKQCLLTFSFAMTLQKAANQTADACDPPIGDRPQAGCQANQSAAGKG